jgi:GT2 family glycosyltransferase
MPPLVAIIILNCNQAAYTLDCLDSLSRLQYPGYRVLVVDNGSEADDAGRVVEKFPDVSVLCLPENLGVAGGRNAGLREGLEWRPRYVVFLDNDTLVAPDLLNHLVERAESDPRIGAVQPKIYYADPPDRICSVGGEFYPRISHYRHPGSGRRGSGRRQPAEVDWLSGCATMARASMFSHVGFLDETYSPYCHEDVDWSLRLRRAGYKLIIEPAAVVWHRVSCQAAASPEKLRNQAKGHVLFLRFHTRAFDLPLSVAWLALHVGRRYLLPALARRDWQSVGAVCSGIRAGLQQAKIPIEFARGGVHAVAGRAERARNPRRPRVLLLGTLGPADSGPACVYETLLQSRFAQRFEVNFLDLQLSRHLSDFERIRPGKMFRVLWLLLLTGWNLWRRHPDIVCLPLATNRNAFLKDSLFLWIAAGFSVPTIILEHGTHIPALYRRSGRLMRWWMRATLRHATGCIVLAERLRFNFEQFLEEERITAVHLGIAPFSGYSPEPAARTSGPRVLFLSALLAIKGVKVLLEALPRVLATRPDLRCIVAGGWGRDRDQLQPWVEAFLANHHLEDAVEITGPVAGGRKSELLRQADIFVFPTLADSYGIVLLEAMRAGVPIVASRVGAIPEIVVDGLNGLLCEPGDSDQLAEKILELADDPELRAKMRQNNLQRFRDYFTAEKFAERMIRVFESVLGEAVREAKQDTRKRLLGAAGR